jgi:ABC-type lipoprotein release transport system permease subunit|tara:strand:- start:324 stop:443 length:120 start_codon:yes stop_codon:yes gene_type:complete
MDIVTFLEVAATMLLIGLLATSSPAQSASNADRIESLRG